MKVGTGSGSIGRWFQQASIRRRGDAIFTNRRRLHLAQPAPEPVGRLVRRDVDLRRDRPRLAQVDALAIRPRRTGTRRRISSASSPPTSATTQDAQARPYGPGVRRRVPRPHRHGQAEGGARCCGPDPRAAVAAGQRQEHRPRPRASLLSAMQSHSRRSSRNSSAVIGSDHFAASFSRRLRDGELRLPQRDGSRRTECRGSSRPPSAGVPRRSAAARHRCQLVTRHHQPVPRAWIFRAKPRHHSRRAARRARRAGDPGAAHRLPSRRIPRPRQEFCGGVMKSAAIIDAVEGVTKKWTQQRKREEKERSALQNRHYAMTRYRHVSIKDAAWQIMATAYKKASANGTLPAHARQVMYAARAYIQRTADRNLGDKLRPVLHADAPARLHQRDGRSLERRLRCPRTLPRAAHEQGRAARHAPGPRLPRIDQATPGGPETRFRDRGRRLSRP